MTCIAKNGHRLLCVHPVSSGSVRGYHPSLRLQLFAFLYFLHTLCSPAKVRTKSARKKEENEDSGSGCATRFESVELSTTTETSPFLVWKKCAGHRPAIGRRGRRLIRVGDADDVSGDARSNSASAGVARASRVLDVYVGANTRHDCVPVCVY